MNGKQREQQVGGRERGGGEEGGGAALCGDGEVASDAAAQPILFRLRAARSIVRQHDRRRLRLHSVLRRAVRSAFTLSLALLPTAPFSTFLLSLSCTVFQIHLRISCYLGYIYFPIQVTSKHAN